MSDEETVEPGEFRREFRLSGAVGVVDGRIYEHEQTNLLVIEPDESGEIVVRIRVPGKDLEIESSVKLSLDAARRVADSLRQTAVELEAEQFSEEEEP